MRQEPTRPPFDLASLRSRLFQELGLTDDNDGACHDTWIQTRGTEIPCHTPIDGSRLATVRSATGDDYETVSARAIEAFQTWREVPAPRRGEVIHALGNELRRHKDALGTLVSLEMGKIKVEGDGEVQEMIDVCDFAVGLSRQLYGKTMPSERSESRMMEQWHPLGPIGLITAFNFPVAVWAWNFAIGSVAGDVTVWKPSSKTPLTAIAVTRLVQRVLAEAGMPRAVASLLIGSGAEIGRASCRERVLTDV